MLKLRTSWRLVFRAARCLPVLLAVGHLPSASAREVKVPEPILDAVAAKEFPQSIFDRIGEKITAQTTFEQLSPEGIIRWWTRTIKLIEFVKAPSQTYPDTYLYAMRYLVSVQSEKDTLAMNGTSCQVVVVYKDGAYDEPTVVCEPVNLDRQGGET